MTANRITRSARVYCLDLNTRRETSRPIMDVLREVSAYLSIGLADAAHRLLAGTLADDHHRYSIAC